MPEPQIALPGAWWWTLLAAYVALLALAARRAAWGYLAEGQRIHVFLGSCVALMVLWTVRAGVVPGLSFHFLGATLLTLMFRRELALVAFSAVLIGSTLAQGQGWALTPLLAVSQGLVPILVTDGLRRLIYRRLPRQIFVYIFLNAFFGTALAVLASVLATAGLFAAVGLYSGEYLLRDYLAFAPLIMFSEAWLTGMLVAVFVGYRPDWLATFDDRDYLRRPP